MFKLKYFIIFAFLYIISQDKFHSTNILLKQHPNKKGCVSCHYNLESIMPTNSGMMEAIYIEGEFVGDPNGCVVCHGGNPKATTKEQAHQGSPKELKEFGARDFYPNPGDLAIAEFTCGLCHETHVENVKKSLMNTYTGGISQLLKSFPQKQTKHYGTVSIKDEEAKPDIGTEEYFNYMKKKIKNKKYFPKEIKKIPHPTLKEIKKNPSLVAFAFHQINCQQCHVSGEVKNQILYQKKNYRSMGCSACHMPYATDGKYYGKDNSINKQETGHISLHKMNISHNGGIPLENCFSCHKPSYNGDYQSIVYESFYEEKNKKDKPLSFYVKEFFAKKGNFLTNNQKVFHKYKNDLHHKANMLCQDCHTTIDVHGDGNLFANALSQVEIECQDCHGTPDKYPWQLPVGYSDGTNLSKTPRGIAEDILNESTFAKTYPKKDGYLLTARGNPYGNVVKDGEEVIVHTVSGDKLIVPLLKSIKDKGKWKSDKAKLAMENQIHMKKLECYSCHSHSSAQKVYQHEISIGNKIKINSTLLDEKITAPVIGINQEGRYSPLLMQDEFIIRQSNKVIQKIKHKINYSKKVKDNPMFFFHQPHSVTDKVKDCKDCHDN